MPSSDPDSWPEWALDELRRYEKERPAPPDASLLPRLTRYEIKERVGEGATATVYRAWDRDLKRPVALKALRERTGMNELARQRFRREAEAVASLAHPNVVTIYDAGEENGQLYLVMELVEGRSLAELLAKERGDETALLRLVEKIARGVGHAHTKGIIHRDLKPANILVTASGDPKVADFGLAHLVDTTNVLTRTGSTLGTPLYMAPEQVEGRSKDLTPRTDVYALGAILYETLVGRPPYLGDTPMEIYNQILRGEPLPPRRLKPKLSGELEAIVLKALDREPSRRYPAADALAEDLRRFCDGEPVQARPTAMPTRLWRKAVRQRRILLPTLGSLVLAIGFGSWAAASARWRSQKIADGLAAAAAQEREGKDQDSLYSYRAVLSLEPANAEATRGAARMDLAVKAREAREAARREAERVRDAPKPLERGLIGWWTFEDAERESVPDALGRGNVGRITAPWKYVPGQIGKALSFQGPPGEVEIPGFSRSSNALTLSAWVFHSELPTQPISYVSVGVATLGAGGTDASLEFSVKLRPREHRIQVQGLLRKNRWTFVSGTWDGATLHLYRDGYLVGSRRLDGVLEPSRGAHLASVTEPANGAIDDVRIYERALPPTELRELRREGGATEAEAWVPLFDGRTLDCIVSAARPHWRVEGGALMPSPGKPEAAQTRTEMADAEVRFRFEVQDLESAGFAVRQGPQGSARVRLATVRLRELEGKPHELIFRCLGEAVTATLDGEEAFVEMEGQSRSGRIQFTGAGKSLRILSLETRTLE